MQSTKCYQGVGRLFLQLSGAPSCPHPPLAGAWPVHCGAAHINRPFPAADSIFSGLCGAIRGPPKAGRSKRSSALWGRAEGHRNGAASSGKFSLSLALPSSPRRTVREPDDPSSRHGQSTLISDSRKQIDVASASRQCVTVNDETGRLGWGAPADLGAPRPPQQSQAMQAAGFEARPRDPLNNSPPDNPRSPPHRRRESAPCRP